ncbi:MAG: PD40 domain-containing protein [Chloroflexi bacterium]|nr:PD40 domain-containing protein [Chloroflexota bacterium]
MRRWKLLLLALFTLSACNLIKPAPTPTTTPPRATALPPGHIRVSPDKAVDIPAPGGVTLSVPQGSFSQAVVLQVEHKAKSALPQATSNLLLVSDVYEVKSDSAASFAKPVTLRIPYDPNRVPQGANPQALTVVWWDGETWREVPSTVDAQAHVISARIDHFSLLSAAWSVITDLAYDATGLIRSTCYDGKYIHASSLFTIHYHVKPLAQKWVDCTNVSDPRGVWSRLTTRVESRPPQKDANGNGVPDYVEDLGRYLFESHEFFEGRGPTATRSHFRGLDIPVSGTIHVFVDDLGYRPGSGGLMGSFFPIGSHIRIDNKLDNAGLKGTAAHELFHYWQYSVQWAATGTKHMWWMEATSAWAEDEVFDEVNLYVTNIRQHNKELPRAGFYRLGTVTSADVSEFYAAGSLAKYLESRFSGFIMDTFNPNGGLSLSENWPMTFDRLFERRGTDLIQVFREFVASYFYHRDYDEDISAWLGSVDPATGTVVDPLMIAGRSELDDMYHRLQEDMPDLSGRLISVLNGPEMDEAKLVFKQHGTGGSPTVMVFAESRPAGQRQRVPLPGDPGLGRLGVILRQQPDGMLVINGFGAGQRNAPVQQAFAVIANPTWDGKKDPLDLEVYVLQPPPDVRVQGLGKDMWRVTWTTPPLPVGKAPQDQGARKTYRLYRQAGGGDVLIQEVDAGQSSLELPDEKLRGGLREASVLIRTVDKYGNESRDSNLALVLAAGPTQPPSAKLTGHIYLGATPSGQVDQMNDGLYVITAADGKYRLISPRAINGISLSPDGTKLAAGMLPETGKGPGDPQLAIFDAEDPAFKLLRAVFEVRPGKGPEQLTGPTWASDSLTLAMERVGDIHLYRYAQDKAQDKASFWAIWEGYSPAWSPTDNRLVTLGKSGDGLYLLDDATKGAYQFDPKYEIWAKEASQGFRELRQGAVKKIEGSPSDARAPRWSPDGKNIVFSSKGVIMVIPATGGSPKALTPADWKAGVPVYSPDGAYMAFVRLEAEPNGGIWAMKADGSEPRQVVKTDLSHVWRIDLDWGP